MASKQDFVSRMQQEATKLAQVVDALANLETVYFDRGYNGGGADPVVDQDVSTHGIVAADVTNMITLIQQLRNFSDNTTVVVGDYDATLNRLRTDV